MRVNKIDKALLSAVICVFIVGVAAWIVKEKTKEDHHISYQTREAIALQIKSLEKEPEKEAPVPPKPEEPKEKELKLPCPAVVGSLAPTYEFEGDKAVRTGALKNQSFKCIVIKKIDATNGIYFLVKMNEPDFFKELKIVQESDVKFTSK